MRKICNYLDIELDNINETRNKNQYKLSDFKEKNVILYFSPQDSSPICPLS